MTNNNTTTYSRVIKFPTGLWATAFKMNVELFVHQNFFFGKSWRIKFTYLGPDSRYNPAIEVLNPYDVMNLISGLEQALDYIHHSKEIGVSATIKKIHRKQDKVYNVVEQNECETVLHLWVTGNTNYSFCSTYSIESVEQIIKMLRKADALGKELIKLSNIN